MSLSNVPHFGPGEVNGVEEYLVPALERMSEKIGLTEDAREKVIRLFLESLKANKPMVGEHLNDPMTEIVPEGRALMHGLCDTLIDRRSELRNSENFDIAKEHLAKGGNVLLTQNHRSGADSLIMEDVIRKVYGNKETDEWAYMSGHAVNLFTIPLLITSGLRRFQIFSTKYKSMSVNGGTMQETGQEGREMAQQNIRAMRALRKHTKDGGKLVVLYPEGGRGDNAMKRGEPTTVCVAESMGKSEHPLVILPTYVEGATSILPVTRTDNEYNEFVEIIKRGTGHMTVGAPINWNELKAHSKREDIVEEMRMQNLLPEGYDTRNVAIQRMIISDIIMRKIANLAPEKEAGPYGDPKLKSVTEKFMAS